MRLRGFTLIELLFVVAVIGVVSALVLFYLASGRTEQLLVGSANQVATLLRDARGRTLAARNGSAYGVHLDIDKAVLFASSYVVGGSGNESVELDSSLEIASVSLAGGGTDITFQKLSGKTGQAGSFVVRLKSDASKYKTITVSTAGVVSLQ